MKITFKDMTLDLNIFNLIKKPTFLEDKKPEGVSLTIVVIEEQSFSRYARLRLSLVLSPKESKCKPFQPHIRYHNSILSLEYVHHYIIINL